MNTKILEEVNAYYSEKILKNGATPQGVDWNSAESQELRFEQLRDVIVENEGFSVLDYGSGFGSMYSYLKKKYNGTFHYTGFDISEEMIAEARKQNTSDSGADWFTQLPAGHQSDYVIASGIFNVRLKNAGEDWLNYIIETLHTMNRHAKKGFSFNILTSYSDKEFMKDYLYYADPLFFFDYCKTHFSKYVALKHDYPLYEFSIIVRK